jgi:hypothetical protein
MAKQTAGILGGFNGKVGPVIGYVWRGRWCMRARPRKVHNPRTEAQQAHRMQFRDMVQTASQLTAALRYGMRQASLEQGLTEGNLFVRMNKDCFSAEGVDYTRLLLSSGPLAPVAFAPATVDERGVMRVEFEKNPLRLRASSEDKVYVAAYCPELGQLVMAAPALRRSKRVVMALPDEWAGREFHLWGFVQDYQLRASECQYIPLAETGGEGDGNNTENFDYETDNSVFSGRGGMVGGMVPTGDGFGLEGRREDGDLDTLGRGAGGTGGDAGRP